jgi:hypothetical protein
LNFVEIILCPKIPGEADRAGREAGSAAEEAAEGSDQAGVLQVQHGGEALPGPQQAGLPISPIVNIDSTIYFFRYYCIDKGFLVGITLETVYN